MKFGFKRLVNRLVGRGPYAVQPFNELFPPVDPTDHLTPLLAHVTDTPTGVRVTVAADRCAYAPTPALLGSQLRDESLREGVSPVRRLFSVKDAGIAGDDGVVYCASRRIAVEESVRVWDQPPRAHPLFAAPGFPPARPLRGLTLSLASVGAGGFYHFLIESLPRLELARPWLAKVDHILAPGRSGDFQEAWLVLAGVPREKIIWLGGLTHYRCEQLLFTSPLSHDSQPTPWLVHAVRRTVNQIAPARGKRHLWISRRDAAARHLAWEDLLLAQLPQFERVELSGRSPSEQIALMSEAATVAGPHGAGLANLVFCPTGAMVIEFQPAVCNQPLFGRLATAAGCRHEWAMVDFERPPENLDAIAAAMRALAA